MSALNGDTPCAACGTRRNIVWFTDNDLWNRVIRADLAVWNDVDPILCIACFVEEVEVAGIKPASWHLTPRLPDADEYDPEVLMEAVVEAGLLDEDLW